jgi:glycosyltransferase involved in cell wall biosynthesis
MDVSIVIPAFNEEQGVGRVVKELRDVLSGHGIAAEIIVVDDGSADKTAQSAALKTGIAAASHDYIVITDADGTYPCQYISDMLARLFKLRWMGE